MQYGANPMKKTQGNDDGKSQVFHYICSNTLFFLDYFYLKYSIVDNLKVGLLYEHLSYYFVA